MRKKNAYIILCGVGVQYIYMNPICDIYRFSYQITTLAICECQDHGKFLIFMYLFLKFTAQLTK